MSGTPLILYIPGLLPKPDYAEHKAVLYECLMAGLKSHEPDVAAQIAADEQSFDIVSWTYDFYGEHRDMALDRPSVDEVLQKTEASESDRAEATTLGRRLLRRLYLLGDWFPFLIPVFADERQEMHIRDLRRYERNQNGVAEQARQKLKTALREAAEAGRPTLLIAHSMGSIISWDSLWQMSYQSHDDLTLDTWLTMGSPLGQSFIHRHIKGRHGISKARYPRNIRRWLNLSSHGDMTAVDWELADDFGDMIRHGLVECIDDERIYNWYRWEGHLHAHGEYGYLVNPVTARIVADWWRENSV